MNFKKEFDTKPSLAPITEAEDNAPSITLVISSDTIGIDNNHFGKKLMCSFLFSLTETPPNIQSIILFNRAVKLVFKTSTVIEPLKLLYDSGTNVIVCKESLKNHGGKGLLALGDESSMYNIVNMLLSAKKLISL